MKNDKRMSQEECDEAHKGFVLYGYVEDIERFIAGLLLPLSKHNELRQKLGMVKVSFSEAHESYWRVIEGKQDEG